MRIVRFHWKPKNSIDLYQTAMVILLKTVGLLSVQN